MRTYVLTSVVFGLEVFFLLRILYTMFIRSLVSKIQSYNELAIDLRIINLEPLILSHSLKSGVESLGSRLTYHCQPNIPMYSGWS